MLRYAAALVQCTARRAASVSLSPRPRLSSLVVPLQRATIRPSAPPRPTRQQVFVGGQHVGGCDDTVAALNSGKLKQMLDAAGVQAKL